MRTKTLVIFFASCIIGGIIVATAIKKDQANAEQYNKYNNQIKNQSHERLVSDLNRAKQNTADPCFLPFFEWVGPSYIGQDRSDADRPKLVMMGEEVEYINPGPVGFTYWLEPKGNKVELWVQRSGPGVHDSPRKIGEKFARGNSACRGK